MTFANKIGTIVCMTAALSSCAFPGNIEPFDESKVVLMQLTDLQVGENIGVITTTEGEITIRFFPSEAPKAVENFIGLARDGYFDGQPVYSANREEGEEGGRFYSGSPDGNKGKTIYQGKPFETEISYNLCPFPGAVALQIDKKGRADSRFFVYASNPVSEEAAERLDQEGFPEVVADAFEEKGGYPAYWLTDAIFAQVIEGQDVVDNITELVLDGSGQEIRIEKVTIQRYSGA